MLDRYYPLLKEMSNLWIFRIRGYQFKSEGKGEPRKNPVAYRAFDDRKEQLAEATLPRPDATARDLEGIGFGKAG